MTTLEKLAVAQEHHLAGRMEDAERLCREVLDVEPHNEFALRTMAYIAHQSGRSDITVQWLQLLVQVTPNDPDVFNNLATTYSILGDTDASMACYGRALAINPSHAGYHYNLATLLKGRGELDEALEQYRESIRLDPAGENPHAWHNLLYLIHYHADYDPQRIYQEHVQWATASARRLEFAVEPHRNSRMMDRKLRIGYVSPLLRQHAISFFLLPLIENHDREHFEVTIFTDLPAHRHDDVTRRYQSAVGQWRDTEALSHEQLAGAVRADGIDILVDVNLHMANPRLEAFARKPAPVQVTYLGYPSTTGLKQIDWRITDAILDPPGENDPFYVEQSLRLPWNFCYRPTHDTPAVNELPARKAGGRITFGCLNNLVKVTPATLEMWTKVLAATPGSRLILMAPPGTHRQRIQDHFSKAGVEARRIEFIERVPQWEYFARYHAIDIALDTYPYPGHTTTCDALWMGVPVVTLPGKTAASRGGASILTALGLTDWIATSVEDYAERVVALTRDVERIARLRTELRPRMQSSPLMDGKRFARDFEQAYRTMWTQWANAAVDADN